MATVMTEGNNSVNYTPHEPGAFMAVCADVFMKEVPNRFKGSVNNRGQLDNRDTVTKLCVAFLTTEMIEIEGKMKPRYVSVWFSASWGTVDYPSNARKFFKTWQPRVTDAMIAKGIDMDQFIGRPAWLTIVQNTGKDGKVYANVVSAVTPPPGQPTPLIPADFVRHKDKEQNGTLPQAQSEPATANLADTDDLPF